MAFCFNFGAGDDARPAEEAEVTQSVEAKRVVEIKEGRFRSITIKGETYETTVTAESFVVPGVYEGGKELWECSVDLVAYLDVDVRGRHVLELGCGTGLPGLWALRRGATVAFSDYNEKVLTDVTGPAITRQGDFQNAKLYAGPWGDQLTALLRSDTKEGFDFIFSADTAYRDDVARDLGKAIASNLRAPDGIAFVATKRYYFGTGGGVSSFLRALPPDLHATTVWSCQDGASNIRDILQVSFVR